MRRDPTCGPDRCHREARELLAAGADGPSLGEWLDRRRFSRTFVERLIVPQASAVWSADPRQMWSFPARFMVEFFDNHGMLGFRDRPRWRTVAGGSARYVEALTAPFRDRLRLSTPVTAVRRAEDHVEITARGAEPERFDEVVMATHSDQALALLADAAMRAGRFRALADVKVPVTLAWGEFDRLVRPPAHVPPGVHSVLLGGCGHLPTWDDPELVTRLLLEGPSEAMAPGTVGSHAT